MHKHMVWTQRWCCIMGAAGLLAGVAWFMLHLWRKLSASFVPGASFLDFTDDGAGQFRILGVEINLLAVIQSDVEVR